VAPSVSRALRAIDRYAPDPEQLDRVILAAINVTLCLAAGGADAVSEGFNRDVAANGAAFGRTLH
jgi:cell division protein ZapA (FtsZ GTPase activity inhibitor)